MLRYFADDNILNANEFIRFANQVWPGDYDEEKTEAALERTINITARDGETLVGCLRILTDGCFFGTITELMVLPDYRKQGIGSRLLQMAREHTPDYAVFWCSAGARTIL